MTHTTITSVAVRSSNGKPAAGFKAQVFDQPLAGFDVFTGTNGAGKTTRLLAIVAAAEGLANVPTDSRRPYLGDLPANTAVVLTTSEGEVYRDISVSRGKFVAEADEAAKQIVGRTPTAWDLSDFASGTDGDRGKILDLAAKAGGVIAAWSITDAQDHVRDILIEDDAEDRSHAPLDAVIAALPSAADAASWLTNALGWAEKEQTRTNADQKAAVSFRDGLTQRQVSKVDVPAETDAARRTELQATLAELKRSEADVTKAEQALARHIKEGERLEEQLAATAAEGARLKEPTPAPAGGYDATADKAKQAELEADLVKAREALTVAKQAETDAQNAYSAANAVWREASEADTDAASASVTAEHTLDTLVELTSDDQCCQDCGSTDPFRLKAKVAEARTAHDAAVAKWEEAQAALKVAHDNAKALESARDDARKAVAPAAQAVTNIERDIATITDTIKRETLRAAQATSSHAEAEQRRERDLVAARQRYASTAKALKEWKATPAPTVPNPADPEKVAAVEAELAEIQARDTLRVVASQHADNVKAAIAKVDAAVTEWTETRALVAALKQSRDDLAAAAYGPIEAAARDLVDGVPGLPTPFFTGPGDFGAVIEGRGRVQYAGLSESEQRITGACFVYALAVISAQPCRLVLLDGLDVVQRDHRAPLLSAFAQARASGKVDNIVVTCQVSADEAIAAVERAELAVQGATLHTVTFEPVTDAPDDIQPAPITDAVDLDSVPF